MSPNILIEHPRIVFSIGGCFLIIVFDDDFINVYDLAWNDFFRLLSERFPLYVELRPNPLRDFHL